MKKQIIFLTLLAICPVLICASSSLAAGAAQSAAQFQATTCGSVIDAKTGLEWYVGPDKDGTWDEANSWVAGLGACGGGWRLPMVSELKGLFKKGSGKMNIDPAFKMPFAWWVWSSDTESGQYVSVFYFLGGSESKIPRIAYYNTRILAVRARK